METMVGKSSAMGDDEGPIDTTVATYLSRLAQRCMGDALPDSVMHAASRCVIDWFAATLPGADGEPARALEIALADELGSGQARTLSGLQAPARTAALINATASHTVELDDIYAPAIYHPGSPTIAAALAEGQTQRSSGERFLRAVIAGYEVSTRIGEALGPAHYRYWHTTGTVGTFGAATAAGVLRGLNEAHLARALNVAATLASGLQQAFRGRSQIKPLHAGHAADAGLIAAGYAAAGIDAAPCMFEGPVGLGAAMGHETSWDTLLAEPWSRFAIEHITIKNHACCGHIFAALDGVMALQTAHAIAPDAIEHIAIGGYRATFEVTGAADVSSAAAAKFSLPFVVASGLVHGAIRLDAFSDERLADPRVAALMPRISVEIDPEVDRAFPHQRAARCTITMRDGRTFERFQPARIGDPALPLSDDALDAKFIELAGPVLKAPDAQALLRTLKALQGAPDLDALAEITTRTG
ncbi:MAG: MmgE/PrpD family protein [Pseudomonadota bacterium]